MQQINAQSNRLKIYNTESNQDNNDNNEVLGTDILNAAVALADHQGAFSGKFKNFENTSVSYHTQDTSSSDNVMGNSSYEFLTNAQNNRTSSNCRDRNCGDEFLEEQAANDEGTTVCGDNPPTMMIRSVTLAQKGKNPL